MSFAFPVDNRRSIDQKPKLKIDFQFLILIETRLIKVRQRLTQSGRLGHREGGESEINHGHSDSPERGKGGESIVAYGFRFAPF